MEELLLSPADRKILDETARERQIAFEQEVAKDLEALEREMRGTKPIRRPASPQPPRLTPPP